jgi:hypothetical protein
MRSTALDRLDRIVEAHTEDASSRVLGFAERNVNAAFDLAQKLAHVKDAQEALALESEFLKTQLNALQIEAQEISKLIPPSAADRSK